MGTRSFARVFSVKGARHLSLIDFVPDKESFDVFFSRLLTMKRNCTGKTYALRMQMFCQFHVHPGLVQPLSQDSAFDLIRLLHR